MHLVGLRVMAAESETVGHTVSAVGEQTNVKAGHIFLVFSWLSLVGLVGSWDEVTHVQGSPDSVKPLWRLHHRHTQKSVSMVILHPFN